LSQDGCNAILIDEAAIEWSFEINASTMSGQFGEDFVSCWLMPDSFNIECNNNEGFFPVYDEEEYHDGIYTSESRTDPVVCNEDGTGFANYVRNIVPDLADPDISELLSGIDQDGCDVLRQDHESKWAWCTFHPEVRNTCSCACEEEDQPKPVCSPDQFDSWIHADLGEQCTELFVSGLVEEHISACGCLRTIPDDEASDLFGSECYFDEWSDRSFMQVWMDCQQMY